MRLYTTGYSGDKTPRDTLKAFRLLEMAQGLNALIFDIRYSPHSRAECWGKASMQAIYTDWYCHVRALGNKNYRTGGPIAIDDMDMGAATLLLMHQTTGRDALLLCACETVCGCHRAIVADYMLRLPGVVNGGEIARWGGREEVVRGDTRALELELFAASMDTLVERGARSAAVEGVTP